MREAYLAGGFKFDRGTASKFFRRPIIAARIQEIVAERQALTRAVAAKAVEESGMDRAWTLRNLRIVALVGMRGHPRHRADGTPVLDPAGNQLYGKPDLNAAKDALKLIGQENGMFRTQIELGGPGDFARLSDAELQKELLEQAQKLGLPKAALKLLEYQPAEEEEEV